MQRSFEEAVSVSLISQLDSGSIFSTQIFDLEGRKDIPFLVDNGLDIKSLLLQNSEIYTITSVVQENPDNPYWGELIEGNHVLGSFTRSDFKENGGVVYVTGPAVSARSATAVFYNTQATSTTCPKGNATSVTLTSTFGTTYVCSHLTEGGKATDFGLLVNTVALAYPLITQDTCLGWCSAPMGSYAQDARTRKLVRWSYKINNSKNVSPDFY